MADETTASNGNEPGLNVPVLHFAHKHTAMIAWLLDEGDKKRLAYLRDDDARKKPEMNAYGELHKYLAEHGVVKTFPKTDSKEGYVFTKPEDFDDMLQDDWWLLTRALIDTITGARVRAREAAKK